MDSTAKWTRILVLVFGVGFLLNGAAMLFAPEAWFFRLVPGVPETGPFNSHLVRDIGTFYAAVGLGLAVAARDPIGNALAVVIAAGASLLHALLHIYSHLVGLLHGYIGAETALIYIPTAVLVGLAAFLMAKPRAASAGDVRLQERPATRSA